MRTPKYKNAHLRDQDPQPRHKTQSPYCVQYARTGASRRPPTLTAEVESALLMTRSATTVISSGIPPPHMISFSLARRANGESRVLSRDSSRALIDSGDEKKGYSRCSSKKRVQQQKQQQGFGRVGLVAGSVCDVM